ncbi:MAG: hypothetical protein IIX00_01345 [Tidjanibacter sp.]|nr:hypothetical protein [Tidjanibacter sp.]
MECKRYEQSEYLRKVFGAAFYKKVQKQKKEKMKTKIDEKNLSPVDYAIDEENIEIIKYFLEKNIEEEKNVKIKSILERNK